MDSLTLQSFNLMFRGTDTAAVTERPADCLIQSRRLYFESTFVGVLSNNPDLSFSFPPPPEKLGFSLQLKRSIKDRGKPYSCSYFQNRLMADTLHINVITCADKMIAIKPGRGRLLKVNVILTLCLEVCKWGICFFCFFVFFNNIFIEFLHIRNIHSNIYKHTNIYEHPQPIIKHRQKLNNLNKTK